MSALQGLINRRYKERCKGIREQCDDGLLAAQQEWIFDNPDTDIQSLSDCEGETTGSKEKRRVNNNYQKRDDPKPKRGMC
jgi:hypothetical protein